jgi:hypothetical protein
MSRFLVAGLVAAVAAAAAVPASANDAYTTRIEPRPFYGASVTIEAGVRVFRPLPPQRHVIVNPDGRTPLSLGFNDTEVVETSTSKNYFYGASGAAHGPWGNGAFFQGGGGHRGRHHHHD